MIQILRSLCCKITRVKSNGARPVSLLFPPRLGSKWRKEGSFSRGTISVSFQRTYKRSYLIPSSPLSGFRSSVCKSVDTYLRGASCLIFIPERLVPRSNKIACNLRSVPPSLVSLLSSPLLSFFLSLFRRTFILDVRTYL